MPGPRRLVTMYAHHPPVPLGQRVDRALRQLLYQAPGGASRRPIPKDHAADRDFLFRGLLTSGAAG